MEPRSQPGESRQLARTAVQLHVHYFRQQFGGGRLTDTRDGDEQLPPLSEGRMPVDVLPDQSFGPLDLRRKESDVLGEGLSQVVLQESRQQL